MVYFKTHFRRFQVYLDNDSFLLFFNWKTSTRGQHQPSPIGKFQLDLFIYFLKPSLSLLLFVKKIAMQQCVSLNCLQTA